MCICGLAEFFHNNILDGYGWFCRIFSFSIRCLIVMHSSYKIIRYERLVLICVFHTLCFTLAVVAFSLLPFVISALLSM